MGHIQNLFKRTKDAVLLTQDQERVSRRKKKARKVSKNKKIGITSKLKEFKRRVTEKLKMEKKV